ncbi:MULTISPECIES: hypothetical protein [unclassified Peribacillus]|jgi:hypothetical protein|uniref:hypothetical protein n=1 Tax=unclassified Peribacillus TaxID=2675266 RepID=UPI0019126F26|nr:MULTISPECIES: hypothetical protein [unclassified Peribacillus]MBK5444978.1 hypothetical protein [Peribacillus sp. TH24]MBK5460303.1 hypothetical protein [Peribacillus sp. TH27]MBK5482099.1 hypothetical protein [Peribacillus sp. TH16]MBK5498477.1 hypothetical protein [Peribacillus sp. TH14]WMX56405.1 hypothetical protein RE409_03990 [Peribacillus sp. R9-11]
MKKIAILFLIFFISSSSATEAKNTIETIPQNKPPSIMELAFLRYLGGTILEVMEKHGDSQLFTFNRIEKISRDIQNDTYEVSLHVIGYEGPINPPFKLIQMTIRIPGKKYTKYSVISYKHRYINDKELNELTKYVAD